MPDDVKTLHFRCTLLAYFGRLDEAEEILDRACELEPENTDNVRIEQVLKDARSGENNFQHYFNHALDWDNPNSSSHDEKFPDYECLLTYKFKTLYSSGEEYSDDPYISHCPYL